MAYTLVALTVLGLLVGISLVRGLSRRRREMQALRTVMRKVMDNEPEKPESGNFRRP